MGKKKSGGCRRRVQSAGGHTKLMGDPSSRKKKIFLTYIFVHPPFIVMFSDVMDKNNIITAIIIFRVINILHK